MKFGAVLVCSILSVIIFLTPSPAYASKLSQCAASSGPQGVLVVGGAVWVTLSNSGQMGKSLTSSCSVTNYTAQNDPRFLAVAGNGKLAFTQKGLVGTSCISAFDQTTHVVGPSYCVSGAGFDDVTSQPSPPSNTVWATQYYLGKITSFNTGTGAQSTYTVPLPSGCTGARSPEGIREDGSGLLWIADEATTCPRLWKFDTGFFTWTSYTLPSSSRPWFVSVDDTSGKVWITSNDTPSNQGSFYNFVISSGSFSQVPLPSGQTKPYYLAVDHADSRVYVSFSTGYVNEYFFSSPATWLCGSGDNYGASSQPFGISYEDPNRYWAVLFGSNQLVKGAC